jgi:hypothetical protein
MTEHSPRPPLRPYPLRLSILRARLVTPTRPTRPTTSTSELRTPQPGHTRRRPLVHTSYRCQLCGDVAQFPKEQIRTVQIPYLKSWRVVTVVPMVCVQCRMMRWPEARALGDGRRRFWKRVFALWDGETYPSAETWVVRLIGWRWRLQRAWTRWWYG